MHFFGLHRRRSHRDADPSEGRHGGHGPRGHGFDRGPRGFGRAGGRGGNEDRPDLGRFFAHGDLRLVILHLIAEKPRHGYEIIKAVEDRVGGAYSPSPGVVYPTLTLLEELEHVTVMPGEGTKKLHTITPAGRAFLDGYRPALDALLGRMAEAAGSRGDGPHPAVVRAREGLKLALHLRFARGPLTDAQSLAVADALDAAAAAIERS